MQWRKIPLLAAALLAAGCGRDAVAGGQKEVETVAVAGTPAGSASRAPAGAAARSALVPQGTLTFTAEVWLVAEDGGVVPLTTGPRTTRVRLDGSERVTVSTALVPATRYTGVRVVFTEVEAEVSAGVVGVTGRVRVGIPPGQTLTVTRAVPLTDPRRRETLVLDLNASAWLGAAVLGVVPAPVFESAVRIRAE